MSLLNSKFDITSVDNPQALAALAQVLEVNVAGQMYTGADVPTNFAGGTPLPGSNLIPPGAVVMMDENGKAVLADAPVLDAFVDEPVMPFVTLDGNTDYSGAFVRKLSVLQGGFTMVTDQYDAAEGNFVKGKPVTFFEGKIVPRTGAHAGKQIYGFVGPAGHNVATGTLEVIVPQGASF